MFCVRTIPNIFSHLKQLDDKNTTEFIPAIVGGINSLKSERKLKSVPRKLGGLGIQIIPEITDRENVNFQKCH